MSDVITLAKSSRPLSWVNTAFPFALAYVLAGHSTSESVVEWRVLFGALFFLIPYNVLMYGVNDVFDYESDVRNPRKGGVEGALLPPRLHRPMLWLSGLLAAPFIAVIIATGSLWSTAALLFSLFTVIAYSVPKLRFKEIPFLDSLTSSAHFVTPALVGVAWSGGSLGPVGVTVLVAFFVWGMASHAFGAVQDVISDREAGIGSIATVWGAANTVRFATLLYVLAGALVLWTPWPLPLLSLIALPYLAAVVPFWTITDHSAGRANKGWRWFLAINFAAGAWATLVAINAGYLPV